MSAHVFIFMHDSQGDVTGLLWCILFNGSEVCIRGHLESATEDEDDDNDEEDREGGSWDGSLLMRVRGEDGRNG